MDYSSHIKKIKSHFPELDLLKEVEFNLFRNEEFAISCIETCINLCNNACDNLDSNLSFGVIYNHTFNASAKVKGNQAVITFNLGLIEKLDTIISDSINLFMSENVASMTIDKIQKDELIQISYRCCISYLFYHELAHIIQLFSIKKSDTYDFQEQYSKEKLFDIKQHIYEFDADLFGSMISAIELFKKIMDENHQFKPVILFNSLTALLFTTANIIIEYSGNMFNEIYYMNNSHPHPFIRIIKCNEQILGNISKNLNTPKEFFESVLQRSTTMISQILYTDERTLDYEKFYKENSNKIEEYINEIEEVNKLYKELTRYKSKEFINKFIN
ncbi:hypothetical protein [Mariniflexile sp. AS56]|uniref:hypothetical protein n=1 Tax=Mariniflexile sp. AS56 TaxID=3063957 RepID=UPI0026EC8E86|nr:hypothetical protein [Mariniflexile sp. AS56]MDO7173774.1 hypothetical protein [Mariniflexile sp. AS56]